MYEEPDRTPIETFLYVYRCSCCLLVAPYFCALCLFHSLTVHVWTGHPSLFNSPAYNGEINRVGGGGGGGGGEGTGPKMLHACPPLIFATNCQ